MGYMESVLPKTFDWEIVPQFGIFSSKCSSSKMREGKKGSKDQLINHLYQWLLPLVSSNESVFCTHIFLICKQIRLENNSKRVRLMTQTRTVHWKSLELLIWAKGSKSDCKKNIFPIWRPSPPIMWKPLKMNGNALSASTVDINWPWPHLTQIKLQLLWD